MLNHADWQQESLVASNALQLLPVLGLLANLLLTAAVCTVVARRVAGSSEFNSPRPPVGAKITAIFFYSDDNFVQLTGIILYIIYRSEESELQLPLRYFGNGF